MCFIDSELLLACWWWGQAAAGLPWQKQTVSILVCFQPTFSLDFSLVLPMTRKASDSPWAEVCDRKQQLSQARWWECQEMGLLAARMLHPHLQESPARGQHLQILDLPVKCGVKTKPIASGLNVGNIQFSLQVLCCAQSVGKFYFCSRKENVLCPPQISCKILILVFTGFPCMLWTGLVFSMYVGFPELEKKREVLTTPRSSRESARRGFPWQERDFMSYPSSGASWICKSLHHKVC